MYAVRVAGQEEVTEVVVVQKATQPTYTITDITPVQMALLVILTGNCATGAPGSYDLFIKLREAMGLDIDEVCDVTTGIDTFTVVDTTVHAMVAKSEENF